MLKTFKEKIVHVWKRKNIKKLGKYFLEIERMKLFKTGLLMLAVVALAVNAEEEFDSGKTFFLLKWFIVCDSQVMTHKLRYDIIFLYGACAATGDPIEPDNSATKIWKLAVSIWDREQCKVMASFGTDDTAI